jgi:Na+/H+-dicarboxylate symporter
MAASAAPWRWPLHWQILLGLLLGAAAGLAVGAWAIGQIPESVAADERGRVGGGIATSTVLFTIFKLGGDLFLNGLKLIIVPLVTSSIILALARLTAQAGGGNDFARLGGKTLVYYLATSLVAVLIGLVLVNAVSPGIVEGTGILVGNDLSAFDDAREQVDAKVGGKTGGDFLDTIRNMVPPNLVGAAADGQLLGLIVVSMLVGYFLSRTVRRHPDAGRAVFNLVEGIYHLTLMITDVVLRLAPIGVFFLIAGTFAEQFATLYPDGRFQQFLTGIGFFAGTAVAALAVHFLGFMPLVLALIARVNPLRHYKAMAPALLTAFSTSSSSATLPLTMDCVETRAGVSNRVAGFTLPLGATVNMDGTALYECVAAVFICQAFGIDLSIGQQFIIVLTALLTSIGVAGVPSASLVAIAVILGGVQNGLAARGIEVDLIAGMALLFVFDRPLDMCRTAVNVFGDSVAAVVVARSEGEQVLTDEPRTVEALA